MGWGAGAACCHGEKSSWVPICSVCACLQALSQAPVVPAAQAVTPKVTGKMEAPALSLQGDHVFTGTGGHGKPDCGRPFLSAP